MERDLAEPGTAAVRALRLLVELRTGLEKLAQIQVDGEKRLRRLIVQLAGDTPALLILRLQQTAGQPPATQAMT